MPTPAIETRSLTKTYPGRMRRRSVQALDDLNLNVEAGSVFGLLGPNGAGKTTLVKILLGLTHASVGEARVLNRPVGEAAVRARIGYLPEHHDFPAHLSGEELLLLSANLCGMPGTLARPRLTPLLRQVDMERWAGTRIKRYSKGMKQRLGIALCLVHDPDLFILDEPTDGVDPGGRKQIRDIIQDLKQRGKTVFINSHLLSEIELVCDQVVILNQGRIVRQGQVEALLQEGSSRRITLRHGADGLDWDQLRQLGVRREGEHCLVVDGDDLERVNLVIDAVRTRGLLVESVLPVRSTLEELYIQVLDQGGDT